MNKSFEQMHYLVILSGIILFLTGNASAYASAFPELNTQTKSHSIYSGFNQALLALSKQGYALLNPLLAKKKQEHTWRKLLSTENNEPFKSSADFETFNINSTHSATNINDVSARLPEYAFQVRYPTKTKIFLARGTLKVHNPNWKTLHPYVGMGLGSALMSLSGMNTQSTEAPVYPLNSEANLSKWVLSFQPKIGMNLDLNQRTSLFIEYRYLYAAQNQLAFNSLFNSSLNSPSANAWHSNMGTVGIKFSI